MRSLDSQLDCRKKRCRVQGSRFPDVIHKDHPSYEWRAVFRFPVDGRSTTSLDLHPDVGYDKPFASLLIKPGEVGGRIAKPGYWHSMCGSADNGTCQASIAVCVPCRRAACISLPLHAAAEPCLV
jgi:hypothetical protein